MAATTRPLNLGEILDRTIQLYRRNFLLLAGISAPPAACIVAISGGASVFLSNRAFGLAGAGGVGVAGRPPSISSPDMLLFGLAAVLFFLVGLPLILGIFAIALAALNYAVSQVNGGDPATIRASYGFAFRHFWRHVGILFLQALLSWIVPYFAFVAIVGIGAMVAVLVGLSGAGNAWMPLLLVLLAVVVLVWLVVSVLIWLRFSLAYPASVAENLKSWPSLQRSNHLSQGSRGRIFVMFLLVLILTITLSFAITIPLDLAIGLKSPARPGGQTSIALLNLMQVANLGASFLVRVFVMPIYATALVLFYIDQRTRLEGYDIEQLMVQAGWSELTPVSAEGEAIRVAADPALARPLPQSAEMGVTRIGDSPLNSDREGLEP